MRWLAFFALVPLASCLGLAEVDEPGESPTGGGGGVGTNDAWPGTGGTDPADALPDVTAGGSGGASGSGSGGASGPIVIHPQHGLDGDGFLADPTLCGDEVLDAYDHGSYQALHVGRDNPCNEKATYRAYLRFNLGGISSSPASAKLRLYYEDYGDATAPAELFQIEDFGQLDTADWNVALKASLGKVLEPSTAFGWIEVDVTDLVASRTSDTIAFALRYADEDETFGDESRWYGIVAEDDGSNRIPRLEIDP